VSDRADMLIVDAQVHLFTEELPWLSGQDKEWIMGRAICEWLGWPPPRAT